MPRKVLEGWQGKRPRAPPRGFSPDRTPNKIFRHTFLRQRPASIYGVNFFHFFLILTNAKWEFSSYIGCVVFITTQGRSTMKKPGKRVKTAKNPRLHVWRKRGIIGTRKKERVYREIGKISVTFGALTFTSLILGTIINSDYGRLVMLCAGSAAVLLFITVGITFLSKGD
jgi:hypothetical protein